MTVGSMSMPADFKYRSIFMKGKPEHSKLDAFLLKHPIMSSGQRAKIFSSFDALKGFSDAVAAKDELYIDRPELSTEEESELNRKLIILTGLTMSRRKAKDNRISVCVDYYVPCGDKNNAAFGCRGKRVTVRGICRHVDAFCRRCITVDDHEIRFADILSISANDVFDTEWETEGP